MFGGQMVFRYRHNSVGLLGQIAAERQHNLAAAVLPAAAMQVQNAGAALGRGGGFGLAIGHIKWTRRSGHAFFPLFLLGGGKFFALDVFILQLAHQLNVAAADGHDLGVRFAVGFPDLRQNFIAQRTNAPTGQQLYNMIHAVLFPLQRRQRGVHGDLLWLGRS